MKVLVIAAHPDDEALGMGGTIKKLTKKKHQVHLCVVSEGASAQYEHLNMINIRKNSCKKSGKLLGISSYDFLDFPDMQLDSIPQLEINKELEKIMEKIKPDIVYTTPPNDLNKDHQCVYDSTLVATRPYFRKVKQILSYEIAGPVKTQFNPTIYENIDSEFLWKIKAFRNYKSEIEKFPHPRSIKSLESLAIFRGIQSGLKKAEAFQLVRNVID